MKRMEKKNKKSVEYIHTWTGKEFNFLDVKTEDICIEDIAHALSLQCRFNGHIGEFYSVAEHSMMVADLVAEETEDPTVILTALLHDASEAYLGDIVSPLKQFLPDYKKFELMVEEKIAEKFSLIFPFPEVVGKADKEAFEKEIKFLAPHAEQDSLRHINMMDDIENNFLNYFKGLMETVCINGEE